MRLTLAFIGAMLLVGVVFAAMGDEPETVEDMLLRRIAWITEHSDLEYDGQELPTVQTIPRETLNNIAVRPGADNIKAVFNHKLNIIYIWDGFDPMALDVAYVVVHELVHFLQHMEKPLDEWACRNKAELLAYRVQFRWQEEFGPYPPESNLLFAFAVSECREDWGAWKREPEQ